MRVVLVCSTLIVPKLPTMEREAMTKIFVYLFLGILAFSSPGFAMPRWYEDTSGVERDAPPGGMYYGRGCAEVQRGEKAKALAKAKQEAVRDACTMVYCNVYGETLRYQSETQSELVDSFVSRTTIDTAVEAVDVRLVEQETDRKMAYVLVGVPKYELRKSYSERIRQSLNRVQSNFDLAEDLAGERPRQAMRKYEACLLDLQSVEDYLKVYLMLNKWNNDVTAGRQIVRLAEVERKLMKLAGSTPKRPDELAEDLVKILISDLPSGKTFAIYPIEYENTGFVSGFGHNLTELIAASVSQKTGWRRQNDMRGADFVLRGKLLLAGQGMNVVISMTGEASEICGQIYLSELTCESIGWQQVHPINLEKALRDKLALSNALKSNTDLRVELRTDRMGDGPIVYRYGDRPKFALKTNRACYIRLMYIFSDDTRVLMLDNYRVSSDMANEWVHLPIDWEVCAPAGVEQMLVQATVEEEMPPLRVQRKQLAGGFYQDIILGSLSEAVILTRGGASFIKDPIITEMTSGLTVFEK